MTTPLKKPGIPATSHFEQPMGRMLAALKENIELMTGARTGSVPLTQLPAGATNAQIIAAVNAIIQRINAAGQ